MGRWQRTSRSPCKSRKATRPTVADAICTTATKHSRPDLVSRRQTRCLGLGRKPGRPIRLQTYANSTAQVGRTVKSAHNIEPRTFSCWRCRSTGVMAGIGRCVVLCIATHPRRSTGISRRRKAVRHLLRRLALAYLHKNRMVESERPAGTVAQQPFPTRALGTLDAHRGVEREAAARVPPAHRIGSRCSSGPRHCDQVWLCASCCARSGAVRVSAIPTAAPRSAWGGGLHLPLRLGTERAPPLLLLHYRCGLRDYPRRGRGSGRRVSPSLRAGCGGGGYSANPGAPAGAARLRPPRRARSACW